MATSASPVAVREDGTVVLSVKVVPGSSRTVAGEVLDGALKIKVAAPPEKGKANAALIAFVSRRLGVRKTDVTILSGHGASRKQLAIQGVAAGDVMRRLKGLAGT